MSLGATDWLRKWCEIFNPIVVHVKAKARQIRFSRECTQVKAALVSNTELCTVVPEAFFYSLLTNFATRTSSFNFFYWHEALRPERLALRSALHVANFQIKKIILKENQSQ